MADLTDQNSKVTQAIVDLLRTNWENIAATKEDIYYADQPKYPRFPAIAVEGAPQDRVLNQTGLQQRITLTQWILVFHGGLIGLSERRKETDELAEKVVELLHTDRRLGGLVIHGNVTSVEPGFATRGGQLLVAHRVTWDGLSNYTMPQS